VATLLLCLVVAPANAGQSGVTELNYDNSDRETFKDKEYIIINFYDESRESRDTVEYFKQAHKIF